jgi:hypothetical protein
MEEKGNITGSWARMKLQLMRPAICDLIFHAVGSPLLKVLFFIWKAFPYAVLPNLHSHMQFYQEESRKETLAKHGFKLYPGVKILCCR